MKPAQSMALFFFVAVLAISVKCFFYPSKDVKLARSGIVSFYTHVQDWMQKRHHELQKNIVKVKQLAVKNKTSPQEIHFEFYKELPNMKVPVPLIAKQEKKPVQSVSIFDEGKLQNALKAELTTNIKGSSKRGKK